MFEPLQITQRCDAFCSACPFRNSSLVQSDKSIALITREIEVGAPYRTITGGEPLLHPDLHAIISSLESSQRAWRLATGGHHSLERIISERFQYRYFFGFALGTDILSEQHPNSEIEIKMWLFNLKEINRQRIPYSLTFSQMDESMVIGILKSLEGLARPNFVVLSELQGQRRPKEEDSRLRIAFHKYLKTEKVHVGFVNECL